MVGILSGQKSYGETRSEFRWKKRIIECQPHFLDKQILLLTSEFLEEFKLKILPNSKLKKTCRLIGLDGGVKNKTNNLYTEDQLARLINAMPMRKRELKTISSNK